MDFPDILHIPQGINFECTGCGNCCLRWPVPATEADFERISDLAPGFGKEWQPAVRFFRKLPVFSGGDKLAQFPYTLEKQADGRCTFLTAEDRCMLHTEFGAEAKPGMCQLFPYTFTEAPDGYWASVSFAATGVLFNSGKALSEQEEFLRTRLSLFKRLFPKLDLDWSKIEFYDGAPLRWPQYLLIEEKLRQFFQMETLFKLSQSATDDHGATKAGTTLRLLAASRFLVGLLPPGVDLERARLVDVSAEKIDFLLLRHLLDFYFPADVYAARDDSFGAHALMQLLVQPPDSVEVMIAGAGKNLATVDQPHNSINLIEICSQPLLELPPEAENLLCRFIYARLFSKLFFGPGLAHLSLIAGFHHLGLLISLLRIKLKCLQVERAGGPQSSSNFEFNEIAELVRALERRLTSARHSTAASSILQVLLESPQRFERIISLAA